MAKERSSKRNQNEQDPDPVEELRTVRELLFGAQVREIEALRKDTDDRLTAAIAELGRQLSETLEEFRQEVQKELFEISDRLGSETTDRSRQGREFEQTCRDASADLARQLQAESRALREQLHTNHETAIRRLAEESEALSEAKADRTAVAELLSKMATELRDGSAPSEDA